MVNKIAASSILSQDPLKVDLNELLKTDFIKNNSKVIGFTSESHIVTTPKKPQPKKIEPIPEIKEKHITRTATRSQSSRLKKSIDGKGDIFDD